MPKHESLARLLRWSEPIVVIDANRLCDRPTGLGVVRIAFHARDGSEHRIYGSLDYAEALGQQLIIACDTLRGGQETASTQVDVDTSGKVVCSPDIPSGRFSMERFAGEPEPEAPDHYRSDFAQGLRYVLGAPWRVFERLVCAVFGLDQPRIK